MCYFLFSPLWWSISYEKSSSRNVEYVPLSNDLDSLSRAFFFVRDCTTQEVGIDSVRTFYFF